MAAVLVAVQVVSSSPAAASAYPTTIASGYTHACVIRSGEAYCWGDNTYGELGNGTTVSSYTPVAVSTAGVLAGVTLTQITAGYDYTCALSSAGAVYCWGYNPHGQLGNSTTTNSSVPVAVSTSGALSGLTVTQVSAGYSVTCAVANSAAYCWGAGGNGELGNAATGDSDVPVAVSTSGVLSGVSVTQVAAGNISACALGGGAVYCWGYNGDGQLGNNTTANTQSTPVAVITSGTPMSGVTVTGIAEGTNFTCALGGGAVYCWGFNSSGQLGDSSFGESNVPVAVTTSGVLSGVTVSQIDAGQGFVCALSSGGAAYCWGQDNDGQLGNNSTTNTDVPVAVSTSGDLSGVTLTQIAGAQDSTCALATTSLYCWGLNSSGQVGNAATAVNVKVPAAVTVQPTTISAGDTHSCELRSGKAWCWGDNTYGELGNYTTIASTVPVAVNTSGALSGVTLTQISAGEYFTCAVSTAGAVYCWGYDSSGQLGNNSTTQSTVPVAVSTSGVLSGVTLTQVSAGDGAACALSATGAVYCWGAGSSGQLGNGSTSQSTTPVTVTTSGVLSGVTLTQVSVSQEGSAACGLSSAGAAYCWGLGTSGQLGNNSTSSSSAPVAVTTTGTALAGATLASVSVGAASACALGATGAAYCWGSDSNGQLGNNSTSQSSTAVAVTTSGTLSGVTLTQINAGASHTCALAAAGAAYCWGLDSNGQLGNNSTSQSTTAVAVSTSGVLSGVKVAQVSGGNASTCATDTNGAAYCWGQNSSGQLGNPDTGSNFTAAVAVISEPTMISAGYDHACAIRNGNAYCWGDNTYGELGNNSTTTQFNTEVQVSAPSGGAVTWAQISAGAYYTCGLTTTGAAYCWGQDSNGQLGNNTSGSTNYLLPTAVSAPSGGAVTWAQISAGPGHACALTTTGAAYCWGAGTNGDLGDGNTTGVTIPTAVSAPSSGAVTWAQIAAPVAGAASCAVTTTGAAYCWGSNSSGQIGDGNTTNQYSPTAVSTASTPMSGVPIVQVSPGYDFACALGANGDEYCWGDQTQGELGNGVTSSSSDQLTPVAVTTSGVLAGVTLTQIAAGGYSGPRQDCALSSAGAAYCWGTGSNGELGNNSTSGSNVPVAVSTSGALSGAYLTQISEGGNFTCTQDSTGAFYCWGGNSTGQLGNNSTSQSTVPVQVLDLAAGAPASVAAFPAATSAVVYWADPSSTGTGTFTSYTATASPGGASCSSTTVTATTCTITGLANGTTYTITVVTYTSDGQSPVSSSAAVTPWPPDAGISSGFSHACTISGGRAYCWGDNTYGQLGSNSTTASATPVAVYTGGALSGVTLTQISSGQYYTCALSSAGNVYCWGQGTSGQLGNGSTSGNSDVPVAVTGLSSVTVTQISAGGGHACALTSAGTAYCWGTDNDGQLGNNSTAGPFGSPQAVTASGLPSGAVFVQVSVSNGANTCGLISTGAVYCWGSNGTDQIGNNVPTTGASLYSTPQAVYTAGALSGAAVAQISDGYNFTCALSSAGTAYCWGGDGDGQLGNNSTTSSDVPVAVSKSGVLSGVTLAQITGGGAAGAQHACALSVTGAAYCWGLGSSGQLGNNSTTSSGVPVAVTTSGTPLSGAATLDQISAGQDFTCTLDATSTAYCWGDNTYGEDGDDSTTQQDTAVYVGPQAPVSLSATPGNTTATISWTAPAYLNNGTITGYTATASPGGATCSTTTATSCTITGLTDGIVYTITATTTATPTGVSAPSAPVTNVPDGLEMAAPTSLTWAVTDTGVDQSTVDTVAGDQQLTVGDGTGTGNGWHITISATTLTTGTYSLPDSGALNVTGSTGSATSTSAPTATCVSSCTLPANTTTYPVMASTGSSPPSYTIYDTSANSGEGAMTLGGSTAADPFGWWLNVPASVRVGSYTSTVTLTLISGP